MEEQAKDDHLTGEDFFHFIDGGRERCTWGPVERHLIGCEECLGTLVMIVRAEASPTPEEEARLRNLPRRSPKEMLDLLRPLIASTTPTV